MTKEQKREHLGLIAYQAYYDEPGVLHIDWNKSWRGAGEVGRERWCRVAQAVTEKLEEKRLEVGTNPSGEQDPWDL